ncbi:MAG: glycoside hydrolase domain-containing protein [Acidobacteriaceae bacterium]
MGRNRKQTISLFVAFMVVLSLAGEVWGQSKACPAQNWAGAAPNIWAAEGSIKVMLNNEPGSNRPTIPVFMANGKPDDGNFNPWGYPQHPQPMTELNPVWSCPTGTPLIAVAGAGRETVSFQIFISAGASANSGLSDVSVAVSPLSGPGTLTSDNTGKSDVTRYLEGYIPYSNTTLPAILYAKATNIPDPLVPFYDPYDPGNPAVATPFNVQPGTTQGVWVNVSIPADQAAGSYKGTVTVSGNGIGSESIPLNVTVWKGNLPRFDSPNRPDMLKAWIPMYASRFDPGEGMSCNLPCPSEATAFQKYQVMGHAYDADVQMTKGIGPNISGAYPTAPNSATSFTVSGPGSASTIDWTTYDAYVGPALTPGGLFTDGTSMRVFDGPFPGGGAWGWKGQGGYDWDFENPGTNPAPAGLLQLYENYSSQISRHFTKNQLPVSRGGKGWGHPELLAYNFDEPYHNELYSTSLIYKDIAQFNQAVNRSNTALSPVWAAAVNPIHNFLTDMPACKNAKGQGENATNYTNAVCADHMNLSYPTSSYPNSWVIDWSPNPALYMPGPPGAPLSYVSGRNSADHQARTGKEGMLRECVHRMASCPAALTAGTGYKYTLDMTQGVPAKSTAPVPIEKWFYQSRGAFLADAAIGDTGVGFRAWFWIAYKYGLDVTTPSVGDPNPTTPAPGGVWMWAGNFWGGHKGNASPNNCTGSSNGGPSPYIDAPIELSGLWFYPGNELGCYYTANSVGTRILTKSPAVNTNCTSNGYSVCNGISGPVASMRMEQWRRGYEDYMYMYLLGHKRGRYASMSVVDNMGGGGLKPWNALNWQNVQPYGSISGVWPTPGGGCTDSAAGVPNGPTGAGAPSNCPGEWTNNPDRYAAARLSLAEELGFAPLTSVSGRSGARTQAVKRVKLQ